MSSVPRTATEAGWLFGLLQASDTFYPTGAYAHSFGLEGLVEEGVVRDRESLRRFLLLSVLPTLRQVELPLAAHAWKAFAAGDWETIGGLCELASALRAPREARASSEAIGRQRAELAASLHDSPLAREFLNRVRTHGWPHCSALSAALEARVHGAPLEAALAAVAYAAVAGVISAAMKLLRLGQNGAQGLLTEALASCPDLVTSAAGVPVAEIGWFNPWLDVAAARHERAAARLFIS
ncbi:MAG: Urease accessory protein UreF [Verrucomicrobiota bacterium]|jgi:urease accessory protein